MRAASRRRNSRSIDGGNFGADPNPPQRVSKSPSSDAIAAVSAASSGGGASASARCSPAVRAAHDAQRALRAGRRARPARRKPRPALHPPHTRHPPPHQPRQLPFGHVGRVLRPRRGQRLDRARAGFDEVGRQQRPVPPPHGPKQDDAHDGIAHDVRLAPHAGRRVAPVGARRAAHAEGRLAGQGGGEGDAQGAESGGDERGGAREAGGEAGGLERRGHDAGGRHGARQASAAATPPHTSPTCVAAMPSVNAAADAAACAA